MFTELFFFDHAQFMLFYKECLVLEKEKRGLCLNDFFSSVILLEKA